MIAVHTQTQKEVMAVDADDDLGRSFFPPFNYLRFATDMGMIQCACRSTRHSLFVRERII